MLKLVLLFLFIAAACASYTEMVNLPIPDDGNVNVLESTITVGENFVFGDVNVAVKIDHTNVGDLFISLEHDGVRVYLKFGFVTALGQITS